MEIRARLERLREVAYQGPSREGWQQVCEALFANAGEAGMAEAVEYAEALLSGWSEEVRTLDEPWWRILHERRLLLPPVSLARVVRLDLSKLGRAGFVEVLSSPRAAGWTRLSVAGGRLGADTLEALAQAPQPRAVRSLSLSLWGGGRWQGDVVGEALMRSLLEAPRLSGLEALSLERVPLASGAQVALSRGRFEGLSLVSVSVLDAEAIGRLLGGPLAGTLRSLSLSPVSASGLKAVGAQARLSVLEALSVSASVSAREAEAAVRQWVGLGGVRSLQLSVALDLEAMSSLLSRGWEALRELTLSPGQLSGPAIARLAADPLRERLEVLRLYPYLLGREAVEALMANGGWPALARLELGGMRPNGEEGLLEPLSAALAAGSLPRLRVLGLRNSGATVEEVQGLLEAAPRGLEVVYVPWPVWSSPQVEALKAAGSRRGVAVQSWGEV